jgi:hypothetical protein
MGTFACRCGYIIRDNDYPCPLTGQLKWQTETESESEERNSDVKDFLAALENESDKDWVKNYFAGRYFELYPDQITIGDVIEDIASRASNKDGRCVYRCPECERIYIQREFYTDDWTCYEKVE